ncbi:MAG: hypothetical protein JWP69_684 [Flaviaesturariibacter sp.]|nr:hypothetical protein [Flaviaesturariibacter sp.]
MQKIKPILVFTCFFLGFTCAAQDSTKKKIPIKIGGVLGITYEGYGLNMKPAGSGIYSPRRPWNQVRFMFAPTFTIGKNFSLPTNFNFATKATNFAGPYAGIKDQSIGQFITNPSNNFAINPTYKWAELQLGTQYLKYSDLSTGDIGIFGAGFDLKPNTYRIKFFTGISQQGIDYVATPLPGVTGAYQRTHWMFQLGKEREGKYSLAFNFSKGTDKKSSVKSPPLTVTPQEGFTASMVADVYFKRGWFIKSEAAQSYFTRDGLQPLSPKLNNSFKPFIDGRTSTGKDWAANGSIGKRSKKLDLSYTTKYIGAGFQTTGYPYLQPDRWDNTINTRFIAWKDKINVVASVGGRVNNVSNTSLQSNQFIANLNWFTQFSDRFSTNITYNNFGFTAASGTNPYGIKNISNDLGLTTTYTWSNTKQLNLLTFSYNLSKYDERDVSTGVQTSNNTHTFLLSYIPTFFTKELLPDFSVMYFHNTLPSVKNTLLTFSSSISSPAFKKKMMLRGQVQYTLGKLNTFTSNKNMIASANMDYKLAKKLTWNVFLSTNYFKYGDELAPPVSLDGANYLESTYRTGLQYKF